MEPNGHAMLPDELHACIQSETCIAAARGARLSGEKKQPRDTANSANCFRTAKAWAAPNVAPSSIANERGQTHGPPPYLLDTGCENSVSLYPRERGLRACPNAPGSVVIFGYSLMVRYRSVILFIYLREKSYETAIFLMLTFLGESRRGHRDGTAISCGKPRKRDRTSSSQEREAHLNIQSICDSYSTTDVVATVVRVRVRVLYCNE